MVKYISFFLSLLFFCFASFSIDAQSHKKKKKKKQHTHKKIKHHKHLIERADHHYEIHEYTVAARLYEKLPKNEKDVAILYKLAESYRFSHNLKKAFKYYDIIVKKFNTDHPDVYFKHGLLLKSQGRYKEAYASFRQYLSYKPLDDDARDMLRSCRDETLTELQKNKYNVEVNNININSSENDFSPLPFKDGIIFCSSRLTRKGEGKYLWDGHAFIDLYYAKNGILNTFKYPDRLSDNVNSNLHEGPATYNDDYNILYYTENVPKPRKPNKEADDDHHTFHLQIYTSHYKGKGKWTEHEAFVHNSIDYSTGHPSLSPDGKTLYFVSDIPGGFGEADIYKCVWDDTDGWSAPINMGEKINTTGKEKFPFIADENTLYFASNRHVGLGGLDIYKADLLNGEVIRVSNMGYPFNSSRDDFGICFLPSENGEFSGYFSSNRKGGKGGDDIYSFRKVNRTVTVAVMDSITLEPIEGASVWMTRMGDFKEHFPTGVKGVAQINASPSDVKDFLVEKEGYKTKRFTPPPPQKDDRNILYIIEMAKGKTYKLEGLVYDAQTKEPIAVSHVTLSRPKVETPESTNTDDYGKFNFPLVEDPNLQKLKVTKDGYFAKEMDLASFKPNAQGVIHVKIPLEKLEINKKIEIENIYYDFDKHQITKKASSILDELTSILVENPSINLELGSHTDIRGSDEYNQNLSHERAQSAINYLTEKGIAKYRITYKYYGESQNIVPCPKQEDCTEEQHQLNRRTEFRITSF
ncbi:OmpA family protein [Sediminitomix flava]|uniref:WD40 repeat protein n=1 Tax=Sediminitomix flava TaxID=379075 RepID=A0A315ZHI8_SEDFL|nr:OmpA family protein [Sediminitomix flava]PWJ45036.1 WD40 repeat protein [Sediminitomix flava]